MTPLCPIASPLRVALTSWCLAVAVSAGPAVTQPAGSEGWQIPSSAATERNPIAIDPSVLARGRNLYRSKCQRCHGAEGKGDGPDGDPKHAPADLRDAGRALRNPDGVMFYKIWNGRTKPKMPAMKAEITQNDVWSLIHYVKTLRRGDSSSEYSKAPRD